PPRFGREAKVSKNRILPQCSHRVRIRLRTGPRSYSEKSRLGIDRPQLPIRIRLDPSDVVAHRPDLPSPKTGWRNHHRKIRLAASTRESRGNISLLRLPILVRRRLNADD